MFTNDARITNELGLISGKMVCVKKDRICYGCRKNIAKGTKTLTSFVQDGRKYPARIWRCEKCVEIIKNTAAELEDYYVLADAEAEAFGIGQE